MTDKDASDSTKKVSLESSGAPSQTGDETSAKATEENDGDSTIDTSTLSDENKDDGDGGDNDKENNQESGDAKTTNEDDPPEDTRTPEEKVQEAKEKEEAEKERIEERKIRYKNWPLKGIKEPHEHDVLYGRGGGTNHHPGNKRYRQMVEDRKVQYIKSKRLDKPTVSLEILREWRAQLPPGRFLKLDPKTSLWNDVGEKKAREKTSQALREKAPELRKKQGEEKDEDGDAKPAAKGEKKPKLKKAVLKREHTLGTNYLNPDENLSIEEFTWAKDASGGSRGLGEGTVLPPGNGRNHVFSWNRDASVGSRGSGQGTVLPPGRNNSRGRTGMPFMNSGPHPQSFPPDYNGRTYSGETRREFSMGSLGSSPSYHVPSSQGTLRIPSEGSMHQRSGSWTYQPYPDPPHRGPNRQRSGSWNGGGSGREHSFSFNPLPGAIINQAAPRAAFDQRSSWFLNQMPAEAQQPPPLISAVPVPNSYYGPSQPDPYRRRAYSPAHSDTSSPPYNDLNIAKSWSDGEAPPHYRQSQFDGHPQPVAGADTSPARRLESNRSKGLLRPAQLKRDTSNQNETVESKPHKIKRATLNRDQSATSNRLKQQFPSEVLDEGHDPNMQSLQETTEQIRLVESPLPDNSFVPEFPSNGDVTNYAESPPISPINASPDEWDMFIDPYKNTDHKHSKRK